MKGIRWLVLAVGLGLALVLLLLALPGGGLAQTAGEGNGTSSVASLGRAPASAGIARTASGGPRAVQSVDGSSVSTDVCYDDNETKLMCFTFHNGSSDGEWLDQVRLTFPTLLGAWTVACSSQDAFDSIGYGVDLTCTTPQAHEVVYVDNDGDGYGEISSGASWEACVGVTVPSGYFGPRIVNWGVDGDDGGLLTGTLTLPECTPLMLKPDTLQVEGCNGVTQHHEFELWNNSGGSLNVDLYYNVPSGNGAFSGPAGFTSLSDDEIVTFTVELAPDSCVAVGEEMVATLTAEDDTHTHMDISTITNTTLLHAGWQARTASISPTMDNVVAWAIHDGGLWSIGGYGSVRAAQRYDPGSDTWTTHAESPTPTMEYPVDGCYGLDGDGHEVIVLFPDTLFTGTLHRYDVTDDAWDVLPVPTWYPPEGRWGHDVVSLYNVTGGERNVCYLTGGNDQSPGGGRTRDLWEYYPAGDNPDAMEDPYGAYVGGFYETLGGTRVFGFHASWYVPWVASQGAICVGGGADHNHQLIDSTECYYLAEDTFSTPNADLGPLPEVWWGMADGWQVYRGRHQIWMAHGVAQDGTLIQATLYADETTGGFVYGPEPPIGLYRVEGDGYNGRFYTLQGSQGGFWYSHHTLLLAQCPWCASVYLPVTARDY